MADINRFSTGWQRSEFQVSAGAFVAFTTAVSSRYFRFGGHSPNSLAFVILSRAGRFANGAVEGSAVDFRNFRFGGNCPTTGPGTDSGDGDNRFECRVQWSRSYRTVLQSCTCRGLTPRGESLMT